MTELFDLSHSLSAPLFKKARYPWDVLSDLTEFLARGPQLLGFRETAPSVWIHESARIAPTACISGPAVIGRGAEIRHCAFLRGSVLVGDGAVVGNSTELKNCILFDEVQVPHYNYVGDSVLGFRAHMGAGAVTSNVKGDRSPVTVHLPGMDIPTGRKKLGALIGDGAEIGCGTVLNPGTVLGRGCRIYPQLSVRGYVPGGCILKESGTAALKIEKNFSDPLDKTHVSGV